MSNSAISTGKLEKSVDYSPLGITSLLSSIQERIGVINNITIDENYSLGGGLSRQGGSEAKELAPSNLIETLNVLNARLGFITDVAIENRQLVQG